MKHVYKNDDWVKVMSLDGIHARESDDWINLPHVKVGYVRRINCIGTSHNCEDFDTLPYGVQVLNFGYGGFYYASNFQPVNKDGTPLFPSTPKIWI